MSYGAEQKSSYAQYSAVLFHPETGLRATAIITPDLISSDVMPEDLEQQIAFRDQLFQSVLTQIHNTGVLVIESARKTGSYSSEVTP